MLGYFLCLLLFFVTEPSLSRDVAEYIGRIPAFSTHGLKMVVF
jgi:hypothetical protein